MGRAAVVVRLSSFMSTIATRGEQAFAWELRAAWAKQARVVVRLEPGQAVERIIGTVQYVAVTGAFALILPEGEAEPWHVVCATILVVRRPDERHEPLDRLPAPRGRRGPAGQMVLPGLEHDRKAEWMEKIAKLEALALEAVREMREPMALTEATRARSLSRAKTRAQRAADEARVDALCDALAVLKVGAPTPTAVMAELRELRRRAAQE